jgi:hypothetical protein
MSWILNNFYYYLGYTEQTEIEADEKQKYKKYLLCEQIKNSRKIEKKTNDIITIDDIIEDTNKNIKLVKLKRKKKTKKI